MENSTTRLINEKAAAAMLGLSIRTLQTWRWRGCGPRFLKVGRLVKYSITDIESFIESSYCEKHSV